ncbi:YciI family protein [Halodesulfovibrio aestuarii]|uniref:YciI family protein n=1 Tax=Halodesulfovibrio aestuarii TaxID=126333 RepID=A0ABV4JXY6_9BACT
MFIVSLTYTCELDQINAHLEAHIAYLKNQYALGHFVASGRKVPRTGGVILARFDSREELDAALQLDPFYKEELASYEIQEFIPTMVGEGLEAIREEA